MIANAIGGGIFTTSGLIARDVGTAFALIGLWVAGGFIALSGALCYGELGAAMPEAGGEYIYLREAYGPLLAFLSGWTSFFSGFSGSIAAGLLGFSSYLHGFLPDALSAGGADKIVAMGALWTITAAHAAGAVGRRIQRLLTSITVSVLGAFILAGFAFGQGSATNYFSSGTAHGSVAVALIFVLYAYSGWNSAAYLAGEMKNPERDLPISLLIGTIMVTALYVGINALYVYALPIAAMSGVLPVAERASTTLFGTNAGRVAAVIVALCLLGSSSAMVLAGPRVYYAMAKDGLLPRGLARLHPRSGTPVSAIVAQSTWATILIATFSMFERLVIYTGFALTVFGALAVAALMVLRWRCPGMKRPFHAPFYPWLPTGYLVASAWVAVYALWNRPAESMLGLLVVAVGIPFYFWGRLSRTAHV